MRKRFAAAWAGRIAGTSYVTMSRAQTEHFLTGLTDLLADSLTAVEFSPAAGHAVGSALVDAHFTDIESMARTIAVIGEELLVTLGIQADAEARSRVCALQGAVAAGHSRSLRDRALTEQEEMVQAALHARAQAERMLRASEIRFRTVFAEAALGILIGDLTGGILDANQALLDMLGCSLDELRECGFSDFAHPQDPPGSWDQYAELLRGEREHLRIDKPLFRRNGSELWTQLTVSLIRDDDGRRHRVVAMFADVTDRQLLETRLRHLATHDPLTQLPNRALFLERLEAVFTKPAAGARLGLCFIDLDGFKVVNDSFGHDAGDHLLVEIAGRLDKCVSGSGHLVARLGGDEFVVLVADSTDSTQVIELADRMQAALAAPVWVKEHELAISASIGIVERAVAGTNPADVLRAADVTLYWAKSEGKARWVLFDPLRNAREVARYSLTAAMPAALAKGEFFVEYQPVLRLTDGALLGAEALVRWRHPRAGVLGAEQFLTLAEETGLILQIGHWMLLTACGQVRNWRKLFPASDIFVNVHLGSRQYRDPGLVDDVMDVLRTTGLEPNGLQLELTRSALHDACDERLAALAALASKGIRIALGDFGPGHANLASLHGLPAHTLKIDRGFVQALESTTNPVGEQIVTALVSLAHGLGLTVTADGIDGPGQLARLRALGCDNGQGRFLAPAGPPERMVHLLTAIG